MSEIFNFLYVEGDLCATIVNCFSVLFAVEFIGLAIGYLGKIGR